MQEAGKGSIRGRGRNAFFTKYGKMSLSRFLPILSQEVLGPPETALLGFVLASTLLVLSPAFSPAHARFLNLGGSLNVNYQQATTYSDTDAGTTKTKINTLGQQYVFFLFGDFYRLGGYRGDISWMEQAVHFKETDQKNRFNVNDYRLSLNLFPQWSPLSLTAQRINRKTDLEGPGFSTTTKDRVDSLGGNWILNIRRLPRLVLNYQRSELKTDSSGEFKTQAATASTDGTLGNTHIALGYQTTTTETDTSGTSRSNGGNLDVNSQVTPALNVAGFARYTSTSLPSSGVVAPGVDFFQERSYGASLVYRPPLYWWDGSASYHYAENPYFNDFRSQTVQGSAHVRYNENTDSTFGARYLNYSVLDSTVNSESMDASLNYRPLFGLTTGIVASVGLTSTDTTGAENTDSLFQNYGYNLSFTRPWRLLQYRAGYQLTYGLSNTRPSGFDSKDLGQTLTFGLDNTNTRIIHLGLQTTYSEIHRTTNSIKSDQTSYLVQVSADSSYFRGIVLQGDSLNLRSTGSLSDTTGFGVEGRVLSGEFNAAYQTLIGLGLSTNYRIEDYPTELLLDRQIITSQIQYATALLMNMSLTLLARNVLEDNRYRSDVNRVEGTANLNYQIGKLSLSAQYQEVQTTTDGDRYGTRSIMGRASRAF